MSKDIGHEVVLPSKDLFSSALLGFIDDGFWRGALALILTLRPAAKDLSMADLSALVAALLPLRQSLGPARILRVRGTVATQSSEVLAQLDAALALLGQYGFSVQFEMGGSAAQPLWFEKLPWIVYKTSDVAVPRVFNELHYSPAAEADLVDLSDPLYSYETRRHFFYLAKSRTVDEIQTFFANAKAAWQLL